MNRNIIPFMLVALATVVTHAAEPPKPEQTSDLDKLAGQPADLSPWAYAWRADRQVQERPEAYFIPRRLARLDTIYRPYVGRPQETRNLQWRGMELGITARLPAPKGALHSALMWETRVPFTRIELRWPADGRPIPPAEAVEVRIYSGHHWWWGLQADWILAAPQVSADQRTWTYAAEFAAGNPAEGRAALIWNEKNKDTLRTDLVSVFVDPKSAPEGKAWAVPTLHVFGPLTWKRMDVEIEWGFQPDAAARDFSGRIEGYFGQAGQVAALPDDTATKMTGPTAWQSAGAAGKRRGVTVPLLYFPGLGHSSTLSSKMTVWSKGGNFTFLPESVAQGPVLVPEHGICVLKAGSGKTAGQWATDLASKNVKSIRERVRAHPETTWEEVMQKIMLTRNPPGTVLPPYRQVEDPPMLVQLPEQRWTDAWRKYSLINFKGPFSWWGLGMEVMRPARVMDSTGAHETAAKNLERWLALPGTKGDGDYADGDGSFENAVSMFNDVDYGFDGSHGGTGGLLGAMAEHYFLTGDREWFQKHADRMRKAADWIIRQRALYLQEAPNRQDLWCYGLMPPHVLGDLEWGKSQRRWWYCVDGWWCEGLRRFGEALREFDPAAARKYLDEAELYRRQLGAALERSIALAPVRPVPNGTYRSHMPGLCYTRGLGMREADQAGNYPQGDIGIGALPAVLYARALDPQDPRVSAHLDLLEDTMVSTSKGPDFFWSCVAAQMGYNYIAPLYFQRDEVENFLRTFMVNFAGYVVPDQNGEYYFTEHAHGGGVGVAKSSDANNSNSSAFVMECLRNLLVWEDGDVLWLAKATPRAWLEQGKKISVKNAPTPFGTTAYEIVSDVDNGKISATVEMPTRKAPKEVVLRFRHPKTAPIKAVTVNGKPWTEFNPDKETITLKGLTGTVTVTAQWAVLSAQPGDLSFALAHATGQVAPRQVTITYRGGPGTDRPFTISAADPWVKIAAGSGAGHGQTFAVSVDPKGLPLAGHSSEVIVSRSDIPETLVLPVRLRLGAPAPKVMTISPTAGRCPPKGELRFTLAARDQFGDPFPAEVRWSVSGGGAIAPQGVFTSDGAGGEFTVTATVQGHPAATATAQLKVLPVNVAHWKLDEKSGTVAADAWGNFQGTVVGGPTWEAGKRGGALRLNGNQYVDTGWNLDGLLLPCSFAFWVNPAATQGAHANIFGNHEGSTVGLVMQQEGATLNRYSFGYGSSPLGGSAGPVQLTANEWQHVAIVCDGKEVVIYLNGKETARGKGENPITPNPSLNFRLGIGYSGGRFFNGALDDFRIYGRALSVEEINRLMTAQDGQ